MILIVGTIRVASNRLDDVRPAMARMIAASRAEAGCHAYSYAEDVWNRVSSACPNCGADRMRCNAISRPAILRNGADNGSGWALPIATCRPMK